jgi:hypothetical protein
MAHEAGSLMEAVTFVPFQEPGLEFHHAEGVIPSPSDREAESPLMN